MLFLYHFGRAQSGTKFYPFKSRDARERILYANFNQVERDVKNMVAAIFEKEKAKNPQNTAKQ